MSICLSLYRSHWLCLSVCFYVCPCLCLSVHLSVSLSVCPSLSLSVHLSVSLSVCPSVCLTVCLSISLSLCLSICLSHCLSVHLSLCLSICLSVSLCLQVDCPNFVRVLQLINSTHLYACGSFAFSPRDAFIVSPNTVSLIQTLKLVFSPVKFWLSFISTGHCEFLRGPTGQRSRSMSVQPLPEEFSHRHRWVSDIIAAV